MIVENPRELRWKQAGAHAFPAVPARIRINISAELNSNNVGDMRYIYIL